MVDYRKLLDAFVGSLGRTDASPDRHGASQDASNHKDAGTQQGLGHQLEKGVTQLAGQSPEQLLQKAKDLAVQHPGVTQAALVGLAGLLFKGRKKGKLTSNLVKLGGLAVIGGLAYRAYQKQQGGAVVSQNAGQGAGEAGSADHGPMAQAVLSLPETSRFHPVSQTEDDALLFLRTMVAAAASDGRIDEAERARIVKGLTEAGIDPQASGWLEREMASPADVEELAANVNDPEMAAQVYAAARIAIDPDTIQEREFLRQLAEALDLDQATRAQIDETAGGLL
ncbi:tellurite resistance TerB family protein [Microvirga sp. ACRRW]|uniref:tellurite resistance TerB family protein n=1 Tax=Microvirga sp. ACRRW TaxID=2918205 RepID=UPI001EF749CC|nr:tellurite resistance TerB family protein [Microvirga sp. ACRRW]MCG7394452.1 tellurite resistance TerB family protein [Microvirga sp. ACRRW]